VRLPERFDGHCDRTAPDLLTPYTILPGQTQLKWLLGYGEEAKTDYCT
jgi:hypothetical protein